MAKSINQDPNQNANQHQAQPNHPPSLQQTLILDMEHGFVVWYLENN